MAEPNLYFELLRIAANANSSREDKTTAEIPAACGDTIAVEEQSSFRRYNMTEDGKETASQELTTTKPTTAAKGGPVSKKSKDQVSPASENPTLGEEDRLMIAAMDLEALDTVKEAPETTRAAFREDLESNMHTRHEPAAVNGELETARYALSKEHEASKLELAAAEEKLEAKEAELEAANAIFKEELEASQCQLAVTRKGLKMAKAEPAAPKS